MPGPADVDPELLNEGDPSDPESASWALGNLGAPPSALAGFVNGKQPLLVDGARRVRS